MSGRAMAGRFNKMKGGQAEQMQTFVEVSEKLDPKTGRMEREIGASCAANNRAQAAKLMKCAVSHAQLKTRKDT